MRPQDQRIQWGVAGEIDFDHGINTAAAGLLLYSAAHVFLTIVDDDISPGALGMLGLLAAAHRGDDPSPTNLGHLDGIVADRSRATADEHLHALAKSGKPYGMVGGECGN